MSEFIRFDIPDNPDFKQHINISQNAWECIEEDLYAFENMPDKANLNGFLNRVILNCCKQGNLTISYAVFELRNTYDKIIKNDKTLSSLDEEIKRRIKDAFIKQKIIELKNALITDKGKQFQIKLQKKLKDAILNSNDCEYYDGNLGRYLKSILEEYAKLPNIDRERIYFMDTYQMVEQAIESSRVLSVWLEKRDDIFMPYCIMGDKSNMFNYVAGFQCPRIENEPDWSNMRITSYRLSNIRDVGFYHNKKFDLEKKEREKIENEIKNKEVRFLCNGIDIIKIYLTDSGVRKYRHQIHQRPKHIAVDDTGHIFEFHCTERQIINYFFKFGKDAVVVEPKWLQERIRGLYKLAHRAYL